MAARGGKHTTAGGAPITGQVGVPPPPGAPVETAQPVDQSWVNEASRLARANEKDLPPFNPVPAGGEVSAAAVRAREVDALQGGYARGKARNSRPPVTPTQQATITQQPAGSIILTDATGPVPSVDVALVKPNGEPAILTVHPPEAAHDPATRNALVEMAKQILVEQDAVDAREAVEAAGNAAVADDIPAVAVQRPAPTSKLAGAVRDRLAHRERNAQPAASNTDTPSRGLPTPVTDPGKQITGGFGDALEQQYFPLDGAELREVVLGLMDKLAAQLQNDLRFSVAMVYPRVSATVVVQIDCYAQEMSFSIPKRSDHAKTPVDVAEAAGATAQTIELAANVAEFSPDGTSLMPPNKMRKELGLQVPRKQRVATPTGYAVVDLVSN